jgi:hypothetical protein
MKIGIHWLADSVEVFSGNLRGFRSGVASYAGIVIKQYAQWA